MDDLERLREKRLRELQERQAAAQAQDPAQAEAAARAEAEQREEAIDSFLRQILDNEALSRLVRIRLSRPEFADQVTRQLVALAQSGRLPGRLSDDDLRKILVQLSPKDRDTTITRK